MSDLLEYWRTTDLSTVDLELALLRTVRVVRPQDL